MDIFLQQWLKTSAAGLCDCCHFCGNIGVVYTGVKPSAIINLSEEALDRCILLREHLSFVVLGKRGARYSLFLYHPVRLSEILAKKCVRNHLRKLGYGETFCLQADLSTLFSRLRHGGTFPHEIGFFLGYPLKDVLAFMGLVDLPFSKAMGWRMYGETDTSEALYHQVKRAKAEIIHFVKQAQKGAS